MRRAPLRVLARAITSLVDDGECRVSTYSTGSHGYAQIGWRDDLGRTMDLVHRVVWEAEYGPIPSGLTIDHLCRNQRCARLSHLRLLPNNVNGRANGHTLKTECPRGHPYDQENTYVDPKGHRRCRACNRERMR